MGKKKRICVGDDVRVYQSKGKLGPTLYRVKTIDVTGYYCTIAERLEDGTEYAPQPFYCDSLRKVG